MMKHAVRTQSFVDGIRQEFDDLVTVANRDTEFIDLNDPEAVPLPVMKNFDNNGLDMAHDLAFHDNRYSWVGNTMRMIPVVFGCSAVAMAELRDLNRHRTGSKLVSLIPVGFYLPVEQVPDDNSVDMARKLGNLEGLRSFGAKMSNRAIQLLQQGDPTYLYWLPLGAQFMFAHVTTAEKFIYEAELRTGVGAHFRYAKHLRDILELWYESQPDTKGLILEGSAEPE